MKPKKILMIILLILVIIAITICAIIASKKTRATNNNDNNTSKVSTSRVDSSNLNSNNTTNTDTTSENKKNINEETVVFKDKYFITQLNEIYYNIDDYKGRKIEIEGFPMTNGKYTFVGRYGPGCCSGDGYAYIEYEYPDKLELTDEKDWIKVTGTIEQGMDGTTKYVYIKATNVEKLETRGTDKVTN